MSADIKAEAADRDLAADPEFAVWANHIEDIDAYLDAAYEEAVSREEEFSVAEPVAA